MSFKVSVVVPSFNEEGNIPLIGTQLREVFAQIVCDYEIIFVDDGSSDKTLAAIKTLHEQDPAHIQYLSFSRNFGHQNALKAGLDAANGDCVISLDADLQHPPALIPTMIDYWQRGYDVVYTKRLDDTRLPFLKRKTSKWFYGVMNYLSDIEIEEGTADFRLIDAAVVRVFRQLPERDLFIRGLVKWIGFRQYCLEYQPNARHSGVSKYSLAKMLRFALNGITSFSIRPLRLATWLGFCLSLVAFFYGLGALFTFLFTSWNVSGWTSLIMGVMFIGGLQLIILGIIGEYIGKLFMQAKQRPLYIIRESSLNRQPRSTTRLEQ